MQLVLISLELKNWNPFTLHSKKLNLYVSCSINAQQWNTKKSNILYVLDAVNMPCDDMRVMRQHLVSSFPITWLMPNADYFFLIQRIVMVHLHLDEIRLKRKRSSEWGYIARRCMHMPCDDMRVMRQHLVSSFPITWLMPYADYFFWFKGLL